MATTNPMEIRRAHITTLRAEAQTLLARAKHETMKAQVRLAVRDLDEGVEWLGQKSIESRPSLLKIVDITIDLATWRLKTVRDALKTYGPDAMLLGGDDDE